MWFYKLDKILWFQVLCWNVWRWGQWLWGPQDGPRRDLPVWGWGIGRLSFHLKSPQHWVCPQCNQVNSKLQFYLFLNLKGLHIWTVYSDIWMIFIFTGKEELLWWLLTVYSNTWPVTAWPNLYLCPFYTM